MRILTKNTIEEEIYNKIYSENKEKIKRVEMIDDGNLENNIVV